MPESLDGGGAHPYDPGLSGKRESGELCLRSGEAE